MAYIKNTWVDQEVERPKTYEMVNNSDGSVTLVDSFGLVSELGTPVNADNMNHIEDGIEDHDRRLVILEGEGARADANLSNLTEQGEKHFLNKQQITNCLLEVPQRIKLELNNGVLTLKAGSEVIVPNGFEADGVTPKFDYVTVNKDYVDVQWGTSTDTNVFEIYNPNPNENFIYPWKHTFSGETAPTGYTHMVWYDTKNNLVKLTGDSGASWQSGIALPLSVQNYSNGFVTSIDQIFNGFGYIGSITWVDKGVKGLFADGKNADGTYRNIEFTNPELSIASLEGQDSIYGQIIIYDNRIQLFGYGVNQVFEQETKPNISGLYGLWYDTSRNLVLSTGDGGATWTKLSSIIIPKLTKVKNSNITEFKIKQAFRALDYNNFNNSINNVTSMIMPDYTAGVSVSWGYVAQQNGWIAWQTGTAGRETTTVLVDGITVEGAYMDGSHQTYGLTPIATGSTFTTSGGALAYATFYPCKGV